MRRKSFGRAAPWLLLALPLMLLLIFIVLPYAMTFYYSTTAATFGRLTDSPQVGLGNFKTILSSGAPSFPGVLLVTTIFTGGTLVGSLGLGTALALSLHTLSPSVRSILLAGLVATVSGLNVFDLIYVTTGGGPVYQTETMALEMFRITTRRSNIGEGAAVTVILFSLSLLLAIAYVIIWRREQRKWT